MNAPHLTSGPLRLHVRHGQSRPAEHQYVLSVILGEQLKLDYTVESVPGLRWVEIRCPGMAGDPVLTVGANLLMRPPDEWLTPAALPSSPLQQFEPRTLLPSWDLGALPVLFPPVAEPDRGGAEHRFLPLDLFGGVFFLLTRYEELVLKRRDRHGRFPARESVATKAGFLSRPLADEYATLLAAALRACFPGLEPARPAAQVRLSHDVDRPYLFYCKPLGHMAYAGAKMFCHHPGIATARRLVRAAVRSGFQGQLSADPFNSYAALMGASERMGAPAEFYFMAGQPRSRYQETYDLRRPEFQNLMREIHGRGHRIGLHPSYDSFRCVSTLAGELEGLVRGIQQAGIPLEAVGGRQHYLRWEHPTTWQCWDRVGLAYDSTLVFAEQPGFRCGTCREFPAFNPLTSQRLRLRERPLAAMDITLSEYLGLDRAGSLDLLQRLWTGVKRVGGRFEVLIHNCNPHGPWLADQLAEFA